MKVSELVMRTFYYRLQLPLALLLSMGLLYLVTGTVSAHSTIPAHAKVNKAIPAIGSTVSQAPTTVTVFALENINPDPNKSNLFVYSPAGDLITEGRRPPGRDRVLSARQHDAQPLLGQRLDRVLVRNVAVPRGIPGGERLLHGHRVTLR